VLLQSSIQQLLFNVSHSACLSHVRSLSLETTNRLTCSRFSRVRFHLSYLFTSLGILSLLLISLQNVPIFLFPSILNVSLVFLGLYVHLSLYHLSLLPFCLHLPHSFSFFFLCTFVSERLSLSLSLQKTAATNWRSNSLHMPGG
jgi:hypothetical protein